MSGPPPLPGAARLSLSPLGRGKSNPLPAGERDRPRSGQGEGARKPDSSELLDRAKRLRREQTEAEAKLWSRLRANRLQGTKWRRQVPIDPYIADFVCHAAKVIVELDGSQHVEQAEYDERRTRFLEREGYRVLRFWNNDVLARTNDVLEAVLAAIAPPLPGAQARLSLSPAGRGRSSPLPAGERDRLRSSQGEGA